MKLLEGLDFDFDDADAAIDALRAYYAKHGPLDRAVVESSAMRMRDPLAFSLRLHDELGPDAFHS